MNRSDPWASPNLWPLDLSGGYVFSGRAIIKIGTAILGDRWRGDEFHLVFLHCRPAEVRNGLVTGQGAFEICRALKAFRRDLAPAQAIMPPLASAPGSDTAWSDYGLSGEQIEAGNLILQQRAEENLVREAQCEEVMTTFAMAAESGELEIFYRDDRDGSRKYLPPKFWAVERSVINSRCKFLRINPDNPHNAWIRHSGSHITPWMYVGHQSLNRLLARLADGGAVELAPANIAAFEVIDASATPPPYYQFASDPANRAAAQAYAEERALTEQKCTSKSADQKRWMAGEYRRLFNKVVGPECFDDAYKPSHKGRRKGERRGNEGGREVPHTSGQRKR